MKRLLCAALVGGVTLLACDTPEVPPATGGITLRVWTIGDAPSGGSAAVVGAPGVAQSPLSHLDSARVIVTGPTSKTQSVTPGTNVTIDGLAPGSYTVVLEGWVIDEVVFAGRVTAIAVVAGEVNTVADVLFAPTTLDFAALGETRQLDSPLGTSWGSSDATVATVDAAGLVTAVSNGQATITGTLGSSTANITAAVAQEVTTVTVAPLTATIGPGATQLFIATALDANANPVTGVNFFWASSNHTAATVDQTGLATGVAGGTATITTVGRGEPGSAALTVTAVVATQLALSVQPTNTVANEAISPAVQVEVRDAGGALVTTARDPVTIAIGTNPSGGVLSGTKTVNAVGGIATFSGLSIDYAGTGYALVATSGALTNATSAAFDITPGPARVGVALLANTAYVDFNGSSAGSEASNLVFTLESFGLDVHPFVDISTGNIIEVTRNTQILVIPEMELGDLTPALSVEARTRIVSFVQNGGTLMVFLPSTFERGFVNTLFGLTLAGGVFGVTQDLNATDAAGTSFAFGPSAIPNLSATVTVDDATLPMGSLAIYRDLGTGDAAVSVIPDGAGQIIIFGWDWFNAPPNGTALEGGWVEVLRRGTEF